MLLLYAWKSKISFGIHINCWGCVWYVTWRASLEDNGEQDKSQENIPWNIWQSAIISEILGSLRGRQVWQEKKEESQRCQKKMIGSSIENYSIIHIFSHHLFWMGFVKGLGPPGLPPWNCGRPLPPPPCGLPPNLFPPWNPGFPPCGLGPLGAGLVHL